MRMTKDTIRKLRELIRAEVAAGIADSVEDEAGYTGSGHAERKHADRVFSEFLQMILDQRGG
jgi:hypothetical protein